MGPVDVADRHGFQPGLLHGDPQVGDAHAAHADERRSDAIVGSPGTVGDKR